MSDGSSAPAGWYPDPGRRGQVRYWDGAGWTGHTSPTQAPPASPRRPRAVATLAPERTKRQKRAGRLWLAAAGLLLLALLAVAVLADKDSSPTASSSVGLDAAATLACSHFRDFLDDGADGVLTEAEARSALQKVDKDAQYSDTPGIATSSRQMLAAATTNRSSLTEAMQAMTNACTGR